MTSFFLVEKETDYLLISRQKSFQYPVFFFFKNYCTSYIIQLPSSLHYFYNSQLLEEKKNPVIFSGPHPDHTDVILLPTQSSLFPFLQKVISDTFLLLQR